MWGTTQSEGVNEKGETGQIHHQQQGQHQGHHAGWCEAYAKDYKVKTATENLTLDQGGNVIKREPLNVAEGESQKKQGQSLGEQIAGARLVQAVLEKSIKLAGCHKTIPPSSWSTGIFSLGNDIAERPWHGFEDRVKQAKAGAFAEGVQVLKGFGSLTEKEGDKAEMAQHA